MWMVVAGVWAGGGEEVGYLFLRPPPRTAAAADGL